jgi:hypothetical protein
MITFTDEDRALLAAVDFSPDLPPPIGLRSSILQALSPELMPGDPGYTPGAVPGDILRRHSSGSTLVKGATGFSAVPVGFKLSFIEWGANRSGFIAEWPTKPADAEWRDGPDGRRSCARDNGNRIEETVTAHLLVGGHGVLFPFKSTALRVGRDFAERARRVRASIDGCDVVGFAAGKWLITTRLERKGQFNWYVPVVTLLGKFGEPQGPPLEEWRLATRARLVQ